VIFSALVQYVGDVPGVAKFKLLGVPMTEKWFTYLTASSLLWMQGGSSALTCAFGVVIGLLYKAKGTGLSRFRFPLSLQRLATHILHPILSISDQTAGPRVPTSNSDGNARGSGNAGPVVEAALLGPRGAAPPPTHPDLFANRNFEPIPQHLMNQVQPSEPNVAVLVEMGFSRERATRALSETGDSVELALATLTADQD